MAATVTSHSDTLRKDSVTAQDGYEWQIENMADLQKKGVLNAATCSNPGPIARRREHKRRDDSLWGTICRGIVDHQLGLSINALLLLAMTHLFFPTLRPTTIQYFTLSYYDPSTGLYKPGLDDLKHVVLWIIIFTGLRAGTMDMVLIPFAKKCGMTKRKSCIRFAEQAWLLIYVSVFWSVGMYIYSTSSWFASLQGIWKVYPVLSMTGIHKWYYLAQFAFWLQQILVVNIEERRKDHWQMFTHHIITSALVFFSYGSYQSSAGNVILVIMDVVDLLLPLAKMLKYTGFQTICDVAFGAFMVTWFFARHVAYMAVVWSLYVDSPSKVMHYGCYDTTTGIQVSEGGGTEIMSNLLHAYTGGSEPVCFNSNVRTVFLTLLLALQVITCMWFAMICRVAYSVIMGNGADDSRSDDEGDEEDLDIENVRDFADKAPEIQAPKEVEVGVDELRFVRKASPKRKPARKSKGMSSGISIAGHGDKKEFLNRIGCDNRPT